MKLKLMENLYAMELSVALAAEKKSLRVMPKLAKAAQNEELKDLMEKHAKETEQQVKQLEKLAQRFGSKAKNGLIISALLEELESTLKMDGEPEVLQAALIVGAQKLEHHEIGCYSTLQLMAQGLNLPQDAKAIGRILEQETSMSDELFALTEALEMEAVEAEAVA